MQISILLFIMLQAFVTRCSGHTGFEPWLGSLCCVLGQDASFSVPLYPVVYKWVQAIHILMLGGGGGGSDVLASHPCGGERSRNTASYFMLRKQEKAPICWATRLECTLYLVLFVVAVNNLPNGLQTNILECSPFG